MNALLHPPAPIQHAAAIPLLRTLVLCDIVDSTALTQRLGDQRAADLFRKHDRVARALLPLHGGREIDKTDGFLLMFERPVQAVAFALDYQRALRDLNEAEGSTLATRVGIHVGDVVAWDNSPEDIARGAKPVEVEGLVKPITSRLMQLALPDQILLSGVAHALAHRAQGELGERLGTVRWRTHGRYRFKGIPDPIPVFEVGDEGFAPLKAPPWSGKAHREVPFWRRPATLGIELVALFALLAVPAWYLFRPTPAIAFANRDWVVVGDLKNLTGDTRFDDSIQTAFRIGLEQSRHVNVLSDLKARETIKLMQRDPDRTPIDRATGSEIAIRDGVRALILPTVAEIGDRVRVTAEVVDPSTQSTVYSDSVDGVGAESVLPSLDQLNRKLRVRLGEALASVSKESSPLERAATKNLDALRAYSVARRTAAAGSLKEAASFHRRAVEIDPAFALAHIELGRILNGMGDTQEALREFEKGLVAPDRLSPRDRLYGEALKSLYGAPARSLEHWKELTSLYPDFFAAQGQYAMALWQQANDYPTAIEALRVSVSDKNPLNATSKYLLGVLELGTERVDAAKSRFSQVADFPITQFIAAAYAVQRDYASADRLLGPSTEAKGDAGDLGRDIFGATFKIDQGRWKEGLADLESRSSSGAALSPRFQRRLHAVEMSVGAALAAKLPKKRFDDHLASLRRAVAGKGNDTDSDDIDFHLLFAAFGAAREGDLEGAREALKSVRSANAGYPVLYKMSAVAQAQVALAEGTPARAKSLLEPLVDGNELFATHVVLMDAACALHDHAAAAAHAEWLSGHRGRAYTEYGSEWSMMPFNVIQSDLAPLRLAECEAAAGRPAEARRAIDSFVARYPPQDLPPRIADRLKKAESLLH